MFREFWHYKLKKVGYKGKYETNLITDGYLVP